MRKAIKKVIKLPEEIKLKLELPKLIVEGPLGSIEKIFKFRAGIELKQENNTFMIECAAATKKELKLINAAVAHIKNMIEGVIQGFEYKLQICSIHFPISVSIDKEKNLLLIKNFLGETKPRIAKLLPNVEISIQNDIITLKGIELEKVAQCAANIEAATRIVGRDRRIFEDGIYIISKAGEAV